MILRLLLASLIACTGLAGGESAAAAAEIDPQQAVLVVDDLAARGLLTPEAAEAERARWQERIEPARGVRNLIWALAGLILAGSSIALLRRHIWPLLRRISPVGYEILAWLLCAGLVAWAWRYGQPNAGLTALPGLLGAAAALARLSPAEPPGPTPAGHLPRDPFGACPGGSCPATFAELGVFVERHRGVRVVGGVATLQTLIVYNLPAPVTALAQVGFA